MKGWECPKCGRVHAPHIQECYYCNSIARGLASSPSISPNPGWPPVELPYKFGDFPPWGGSVTCGIGEAIGGMLPGTCGIGEAIGGMLPGTKAWN